LCAFLGQQRREAARYSEKFARCKLTPPRLTQRHIDEGISTMTVLPVTLAAAGAAAVLNVWLMVRVGQIRTGAKISIGDGGNDHLVRRMRAHANFTENAPFVLVLIGVIELSGRGSPWLAYVAAAFILARISHALGMEAGDGPPTRLIGVVVTMLVQLGLAIVAALVLTGVM
jgi:hypothetical protein